MIGTEKKILKMHRHLLKYSLNRLSENKYKWLYFKRKIPEICDKKSGNPETSGRVTSLCDIYIVKMTWHCSHRDRWLPMQLSSHYNISTKDEFM